MKTQICLLDYIQDNKLSENMKNDLYDILAKGCQLKTKQIIDKRINNHLSLLPHYGIVDRLKVNPERDEVYYITGQSYPDEIRVLRKIFIELR